MRSLYKLVTHDVRVREVFVNIGADTFLHIVHNALMRENDAKNDRLMLLNACRQAMVCTEENIIHGLGKEMSYMYDPKRPPDGVRFAEAFLRWQRLYSVGWDR